MSWVRLDDSFPEHPKVIAVGGDAGWLHVCALAYCNRNDTDGKVSTAILSRLSDRRNPRRLAADLVTVGLWIATESGWEIHDYLDFQPSKAKKDADREAARQRMNRRRSHARSSGEHDTNFGGSSTTPTRPDPTPPENTPPPASAPDPDGGGGISFRNQVMLAAAAVLAEKQPAGTITNHAGWVTKVARRLLEQHGPSLAGYTDVAQARDHVLHREASATPTTTITAEERDQRQVASGAGYGRAVAEAQIDNELVDAAAFEAEIADRPQVWRDAALVAYRASVHAPSNVVELRRQG